MSEKCLTESDWKSFAKGAGLDDGKVASKDSKALHEAVLEALQELRDLEKSKPSEDELLQMLNALDGVLTKQIAANAKRKDKDGKAIKDTKAVKDQLYKMLSAVDKQRKEVQAAKDKKDKEAAAKGDDEDDDSPAILSTKMMPLIRQLKKGKGEVRYPALIGSISKTAVVLISKRVISNTKRKLLNEALDAKGGVKFAKGECYYETGALHFVMEGKISGLVKRVRAALLNQTGLRLKVKLRGEDGAEEDGIEEVDDLPDTEAGAAPGAAAGGTRSTRSGKEEGRFVHHAKAKLTWIGVRQRLKADLSALEQAIRAEYGHRSDVPDLGVKLRKFDTILTALDESLSTTLDDALNAPDLAARAALHEKARRLVARYKAFVDSDPLVAAIDRNPFVPLNTHATLSKTLQVLDRSLA